MDEKPPAAEKGAEAKPRCGVVGACLDFAERWNLKLEFLCGVTVALAQVPEAVAFSLVAGVSPAIGVNSAWIVGLITAFVGGRPAMICGATGALAVVVGDLVKEHGQEYLFYAVMLMGLIQVIAGVCQVGKMIKMIPAPVMIGFCNGLALVIGLAQFNSFKALPQKDKKSEHRLLLDDTGAFPRRLSSSFSAFTDGVPWIVGEELAFSVSICVLAFVVSVFLPKLSKKVPSALAAIILCCIMEWAIVRAAVGSETKTVMDVSGGGIGGDLPWLVWSDYKMPDLNGDLFKKIWSLAVVLASIGLLESLMTLNLIDDITLTRSDATRECIGQGVANLVCGALGGMGGCAMIGQSMINIGSGARNRVSSTCAGLFLLVIVVAAYPAINRIPIAALAGVMFNVVYHTFEWNSLKLMAVVCLPSSVRHKILSAENASKKIRRADAFVILLVTLVTLFTDLAVAVGVGTVLSCLLFAWESADSIHVTTSVEAAVNSNGKVPAKLYEVHGSLFFGSTKKFLSLFDADNDPSQIFIAFKGAQITDYSALEALNVLAERYARLGKTVTLRQLKSSSAKILRKAKSLLSVELDVMIESEEVIKAEPHHYNIESYQQGEIMPHKPAVEPPQATDAAARDPEAGCSLVQRFGKTDSSLKVNPNKIGFRRVKSL